MTTPIYPDDYFDSNTCRVALFLMYSDSETPELEPLTLRQLFEEPLWKLGAFTIQGRLPFTVNTHGSSGGKRPCVSPAKKQRLQDIYTGHEADLKSLGTSMRFCLEEEVAAWPAPVSSFAAAIGQEGLFFPPNHIDPADKPKIRALFSAEEDDFLNVPLQQGGARLMGEVAYNELRAHYTLGGTPATSISAAAYQVLRTARRTGILLRFVDLPDLCAE